MTVWVVDVSRLIFLSELNRLPQDLQRELGQVLSSHLAKQLSAGGWTEEEMQEDFDAFRRDRR